MKLKLKLDRSDINPENQYSLIDGNGFIYVQSTIHLINNVICLDNLYAHPFTLTKEIMCEFLKQAIDLYPSATKISGTCDYMSMNFWKSYGFKIQEEELKDFEEIERAKYDETWLYFIANTKEVYSNLV